jgi:serine/threonine protein kinase
MPIAPSTTIERYRVETILGEGGMAQVYRVQHTQLGSTHALKVLTSPSAAVRERLLQEGRAQAQLRHRNVVNVTDVIDVDGSPGLVMEYISGPNLSALLAAYRDGVFAEAQLQLPQIDMLARGILSGVLAAHEHGLVHRDLKPANILLELLETEVVPKVADFGLVKVISGGAGRKEGMTRSGMALGTPAYMAPEQVRDSKSVDQRGDLFALGAILYELVTGRRAFLGQDMMEIFQAVVQAERKPLQSLRPDVPARMRDAIEAALVVDVDQRVQSCRELLEIWCGGDLHSLPWEVSALQWSPEQLLRLIEMGPGPRTAAVFHGGTTTSDSETWDPPPDASEGVHGGHQTQARKTPGIPDTTPMARAMDGTLSREIRAPEPTSLKRPTSRTSPALIFLGAVVAAVSGGWWWMNRQAPDLPTSQGNRFVPIAPVQPAAMPEPEQPVPPEAAPHPEADKAAEPQPEADKAAEEDKHHRRDEREAAQADPPPPVVPVALTPLEVPDAPTTARFDFTGPVEGVRLRGGGRYFGPGEVPPGTYQVYLRLDGESKRVKTVQLAAGDKIVFDCNRLGCK